MGLLSFLMFAVNICFWVMGGAMLGVGIWLAVDPNAGEILGIAGANGMDDSLYWASVYMMIGIGAGVFLVGFLGCVGALRAGKKHNIFLRLYFIIVKLIIITEFICIILIAVFWGSLNDSVRDSMYTDVHTKYINETDGDLMTNSWNRMQVEWKCCGSSNYSDYKNSRYFNSTHELVPWTCCVLEDGKTGDIESDFVNVTACRIEATWTYAESNHYHYLNANGCYYALTSFVDENAGIIIGVTCGFIGLQLLGSIMACILMKKSND